MRRIPCKLSQLACCWQRFAGGAFCVFLVFRLLLLRRILLLAAKNTTTAAKNTTTAVKNTTTAAAAKNTTTAYKFDAALSACPEPPPHLSSSPRNLISGRNFLRSHTSTPENLPVKHRSSLHTCALRFHPLPARCNKVSVLSASAEVGPQVARDLDGLDLLWLP